MVNKEIKEAKNKNSDESPPVIKGDSASVTKGDKYSDALVRALKRIGGDVSGKNLLGSENVFYKVEKGLKK
jgi:hypothetical protein